MTRLVTDEWPTTRPGGFYMTTVKRVVDRLIASVLIVATAPLMGAIAAITRARLGPGVIYRQERIGRDGEPFMIYKFRTMEPDRRSAQMVETRYIGPERRRTHKSIDDPRHTGLGRFLRRYSLDELPQLANVIKGDMSLVGPRPEVASVARNLDLVDHPRHYVRPGLTGLWQISPTRSRLIIEGIDLDLEYVARCGPKLDLEVLVRTAPALLRRTGA